MSVTKPTNDLIRIAQNTENLPSTGKTNKQLPSFTLRTSGYDDDQFMSAEEINYTFDNLGEWSQYLIDITDRDVQDLIDFENTVNNREIIAGDGMTGGGNLSADRTITLGTPSTLNGSSTNTSTADSHTHEITIATTAEAQGLTDDNALMTPKKTDDSIKASFEGTSADDFMIFPNGLIMQWVTPTLPTNALVWEEVALPKPLTVGIKNITVGINGVVGGSSDNSNVSVRPSVANPLTHIEIQQIGQTGTVMCNVIGY